MQKNSTIIIALVALVLGLGGGYAIGSAKEASQVSVVPEGMHMMPDGTMMGDNGGTMSMSDMMHDMNASLRGKTGDDLDKAFIDEMIIHHEGAVEMAEILLAGSKRPELIKLGNDIVAAQTNEIEMMKQWRAEWFSQQ